MMGMLTPLKDIPMVRGTSFFSGSAREFSKNPAEFLRHGFLAHGDVFRFRMFAKEILVVCSPELGSQVLSAGHEQISIREAYPAFTEMFSKDFFFHAEHHVWAEQREIVKFLFTAESLRSYVPDLRREMNKLISRMGDSGNIELHETIGKLIANFNASAFFGDDFWAEHADEIYELYKDFSNGLQVVLPALPFMPHIRKSQAAKKRLLSLMDGYLRSKPKGNDKFERLLTAVSNSSFADDGEFLPLLLLLLAWAGQDTGTGTVLWLLVDILSHPEVIRSIRQEISEHTEGGTRDSLEWDVLSKLRYLDAVIRESERRHPVITVLMRMARKDLAVGSYAIPKGTTIFAAPPAIHHHPEVYECPYTFNPERFIGNAESRAAPPNLIGFSAGTHRCAGINFARIFIKVAVVGIINTYDMSLTSEPAYRDKVGAFIPSFPLNVKYKKRAT